MKFNQIKSLTALFSLLFYLFVGLVGSGNFVICQEADGSTSFEFALNGRCADMTVRYFPETVSPSLLIQDRSQHCGDCTDTPILLSGLSFLPIANQPASIQDEPLALPSIYCHTSSSSEFIQKQVWANPPPIYHNTLAFLKTVVLTI